MSAEQISAASLAKLRASIDSLCRTARVPGAALVVVSGRRTVFAEGFGYRDLQAKLPVTAATVFPIASTSKAINATLLGMLVDEGRIGWDCPVQHYLPSFELQDAERSVHVTLRDLITMRTGLPRHDWLWTENPLTRAELVARLRHLDLSAGFRERFQYSNLTVTAAGHIAEVVTGQSWETLVENRILRPLGMESTGFSAGQGECTLSYHENSRRAIVPTGRLTTEVSAPAGGSIHSTLPDMSRWIAFNLTGGCAGGQRLVREQTLREIQTPQIRMDAGAEARKPDASYALGWTVDTYKGQRRLSHGGYLHDVSCELLLFPDEQLGIMCFTNFGPPMLALPLAEHAFDLLSGAAPGSTIERRLAEYERQIEQTRDRHAALPRVLGAPPSRDLLAFGGKYVHVGYGEFEVIATRTALTLRRHSLMLPLEHWEHDAWVVAENDLFEIHAAHAFDRASRILFESNADGAIAALSIQLEPAVDPVRFMKQ